MLHEQASEFRFCPIRKSRGGGGGPQVPSGVKGQCPSRGPGSVEAGVLTGVTAFPLCQNTSDDKWEKQSITR